MIMKACLSLGIQRPFTIYDNPRGNAAAERMMRTVMEELPRLQEWQDSYEVSAAVSRWIEEHRENDLYSALEDRFLIF